MLSILIEVALFIFSIHGYIILPRLNAEIEVNKKPLSFGIKAYILLWGLATPYILFKISHIFVIGLQSLGYLGDSTEGALIAYPTLFTTIALGVILAKYFAGRVRKLKIEFMEM